LAHLQAPTHRLNLQLVKEPNFCRRMQKIDNMNRSAIDTIRGYFYQFDYSIKSILGSVVGSDSISIEGIEDVDVKTATEETAIQCKYYEKTEYNHSVIAKPIRYMLIHYAEERRKGNSAIEYRLYGYYKSGQHKLSLPISVDDLKDNFLTYTENKVKQYLHNNLGLSDTELSDFISHLDIDINAESYEKQLDAVLGLLKSEYNCTDFEAEHYYYNNALKVIKELSVLDDISDRKITKNDFLSRINTKTILFNQWFIEFKGLKRHFKELKNEYFSNLNSSPYDRFFLIEVDTMHYVRTELKELIFLISKKWTKISRREPTPFCPYIYIKGIDNTELIELKKELATEGFNFIDGFSFQGADFDVSSILVHPNNSNGISMKFLNKIEFLNSVIQVSTRTKEIYQFYYSTPFYANDSSNLKHVKIQISEFKNIKEVI
jgi:hypothetical protein